MLPTVAAHAGELLAAALAAGAICLAGAAVGLWSLKRRVRRGLEASRRVMAARAAGSGGVSIGSRWLWSRRLPDRRWIAAARARHELWRAVSAADHAVTAAQQAGAPIGELDTLCRQLRHAAADADRALSVARRAPVAAGELDPVSSQARDLVKTAGLIHDAAASALASVYQPAAARLADDARREAVALAAGITIAARAAAGGPPGELA